MNNADTAIPPPELGLDPIAIHLWYVRRDVADIKKTQKENNEDVKNQFDDLRNGYLTKTDFAEHLKADADHEDRIRVIEKFNDNLLGRMWGIGIGATVIGSVLTLLGTYAIGKL